VHVCLVLHVRRLADGAGVVVTSVDYPGIRAEAADVETAVAHLRPRLLTTIQNLDPFDRGDLIAEPAAVLTRVPVTVPASKRNPVPIEVTAGVVVCERTHGLTGAYVVRVPAAPAFEFVTTNRDDIGKQVAELLPAFMKRWRPSSILAADETDDSYIDLLQLDLDAQTAPVQDRDPGILAERGLDLTARAREGALGRLDGRDDLVRRLLLALADPERSSVLLVGPHAVGKTALVHEAAARIASGDVPASLKDATIWRLSANELIAGAQYTGMWQDRAKMLIEALRGGQAICFMDDPVPIVDAGRWSQSDNNVSRFLRPYMESGDISIICETTAEGLAAVRLKEPSFVGAFHRIDVPEPSLELTRSLCAVVAERLGTASGIVVVQDAVEAAVELTRRFEPYRAFPGKAIAALEESVRESPDGGEELHRAQVTAVFAARTGLPVTLIADDVQLQTKDVRAHFATRVLGQEHATEAMVELITVIKAGLASPDRPLGSFLFVGPTGVGKTELAKALAEYLFGSKERVLRLDMGEYTAGDAVAKLLGSGWQNEDEGELTRRIREQPFSVVLLDEIEKANPLVFDALLSALGEGRLTNAAGITADFRNAIVIMTSNLGATRSQSTTLGFGASSGDEADHYVEEAERFFRPEFFNRIGRIVPFRPLGEETIRQIARRELGRLLLLEGITRRKLLVEVDDPVIEVLGSEGFHPRYGARPLQRAIERAVISPLARLVVDRSPGPGDLARVLLRDGEIAVELTRVEEPEATAAKPRSRARSGSGTFARAVRACEEFAALLEGDNAARRGAARRAFTAGRNDPPPGLLGRVRRGAADVVAALPDRGRARPVRHDPAARRGARRFRPRLRGAAQPPPAP
jgi:ATP-dependent Clp protease ATP-binding subunit ClpC